MQVEMIRQALAPHIQFVGEYAIIEKPRGDLDTNRCLQDIESYGITSHQRLMERLFVCRQGNVLELESKRRVIRRKSYGTDENRDEAGEPIGKLLNGTEDWVAVVSSAYVTQPKGPHGTEKKVEFYSAH